MQMSKLGNYLKWYLRAAQLFARVLDEFIGCVPEEFRGLADMDDSIGIEAHQLCASRVGGYWIVGEDKSAEGPRRSVQRSISFHGHDSVGNDKVNRNRCADVEDAPVAGPRL